MISAPLFAALALMTAVAVMAVLWPLSRRRAPREAREADLAVYRDQLAELDRDLAAGLLSPEQAQAARVEVSRRMLAAADQAGLDGAPAPARSGTGRRRMVAALALVAVPVMGAALYWHLGSPALPGAPLAERLAAPADRTDVAILVRKVEEHLAANPTDGQGYELLAPVYVRMGRLDDAVRAYAQAIRILGATAERQAALGETLVLRGDGIVNEDAARAFKAALALEPDMPKARYFLGLAAEQDGRKAEAVAIWTKLVEEAPPGAPWVGLVRAALARAGAPVPQMKPLAPPASPGLAIPGPSAQDVAAASSLSADQRSAMVQGMVDRLEQRLKASPKDLDGWLRLARAFQVLGEPDKVRGALDQARTAFSGDAEATARIEATAKELGVGG